MTISGNDPYRSPAYPPPAQGTNKLAIWSLVTSLLGLLCGVGAIVGIVLGIVAIKHLNRTQEGGRKGSPRRSIPAARPLPAITNAILRLASSIISSPSITAPRAPPAREVCHS